MMKFALPLTLASLGAAILAGCNSAPRVQPIALADDASIELVGAPKRCITLSNSDSSNIIDDNTIDFREGRRLYRNRLPNSCPGLKAEDRILIENRTGQLCSNDVVYTLYNFGNQLSRGAACGLGEFQEIKKVKS